MKMTMTHDVVCIRKGEMPMAMMFFTNCDFKR